MAFDPSFTASQSAQSPSDFGLQDTSTGSDVAISTRGITLQLFDGTYMDANGVISSTNTPTPFPLADGTDITFSDVLPVDYAISVTMAWLDSGAIVLYSVTQTFCFKENGEDFDYGLTQSLAGNVSLLQNTNYVSNRFRFRMFLDAAQNAVTTGNDISSSQFCLNMTQEMIQNESFYF